MSATFRPSHQISASQYSVDICHTLPGLEWKYYRYFKPETVGLDFEGMMEDIRSAPEGSVIVLHGAFGLCRVLSFTIAPLTILDLCAEAFNGLSYCGPYGWLYHLMLLLCVACHLQTYR